MNGCDRCVCYDEKERSMCDIIIISSVVCVGDHVLNGEFYVALNVSEYYFSNSIVHF